MTVWFITGAREREQWRDVGLAADFDTAESR